MRKRLTQAVGIFVLVLIAAQFVRPLSWLMAGTVAEGRQAVNFSEWGAYSSDQQQSLLAASCIDARTGRIPGAWTNLHPEARFSMKDIATIGAPTLDGGSRKARVSQ